MIEQGLEINRISEEAVEAGPVPYPELAGLNVNLE